MLVYRVTGAAVCEKKAWPCFKPPRYLCAELQGQLFVEEKLAACRPDELSAQAMVYCLFRLVSRVARLHKTIRSAKQSAVSSGRAGVPQNIAVAADMAEDQMGLAKEMLGKKEEVNCIRKSKKV